MLLQILQQIWLVWVDTALWLCVGLTVAALAHVYLRTEHLQRWLVRPGLGSIVKATLLGAPLPLCSCGVLPAAIGLRRAGASREASAAFLISTPETGVDSVAISYALLGPFYAVLRPVSALLTAFSAGVAVWKWGGDGPVAVTHNPANACCSTEHAENPPSESVPGRVRFMAGLKYAFTDLLDDLSAWLVFGIVLAGMILAVVPPELLVQFGRSPWALVTMLVVGVPLYVCAVASTPIAAALLVSGVSPGAVLVFLLAGPATNLGGLALIAKEFGQRFAVIYLVTIAVFALGLGFCVNAFVPVSWLMPPVSAAVEHGAANWVAVGVAIMLALWVLGRMWRSFYRQ